MEIQLFFNVTVGIVGILGGWMLNRIFTLIDRLDKDVRNMPVDYVTKTDYKEDLREIKTMLEKLVDRKADK